MIPALLSVIIAFSIMGTAIVEVTLTNFTVVGNVVKSQQAFNIAEAGLNYYMWHLNHNATDYKDGQSTPATPDPTLGYGPYTHDYIDTNGVNEGTYTLWINPAGNGSTVVTVRSIGQAAGTNITRTVQAQIGSPSFASYAVASDSALWFGNDETADGPIDSNQGVRMDGPNDSTVSSANASYVPSTQLGGDGSSHPGVWCNTSVTSPVNCNTRSKSAWIYPVPQIDFNQVSTSLCTMKKVAFAANSATASLATQANACTQVPTTRTSSYLPERSSTYSSGRGYLILLNTDGTYNLYDVNAENDQLTPYTSALTLQSVASNITIPSSGVIFAEDNVWVLSNPTYHGRVTVAAGRLASTNSSTYANVNIAGPLLYSTKNGTDAIGLVAQNSVILSPYAPPSSGAFNFEVDGALLAENGEVWYPDPYASNGNRCTRGWTSSNQQFLFYGSVATRQTWTWNWLNGSSPCGDAAFDATNGYVSGIENTTTQYDYNLEYAPPPSYPLTSGYNILSWREVLTRP
jgi:Tfp pilus assembly protein PilX